MKIRTKRAYDKPARGDGIRILVDRLWPRGLATRSASIDAWVRGLAPSAKLRKWYHADREERWTEFKKRYRQELRKQKELVSNFRNTHRKSAVTLLSANKDLRASHVPILEAFLNTWK